MGVGPWLRSSCKEKACCFSSLSDVSGEKSDLRFGGPWEEWFLRKAREGAQKEIAGKYGIGIHYACTLYEKNEEFRFSVILQKHENCYCIYYM